FAAAVASFGMILRNSQYKGNATLAAVQELASEGVAKQGDQKTTELSLTTKTADGKQADSKKSAGTKADSEASNKLTAPDDGQYRAEFLQLIEKAKSLGAP